MTPERLLGPGHVIADAWRACVTAAALFVAGWQSTSSPAPVPGIQTGGATVTPPGTEQILDIAIRQGGLLLVLVIVLFFYRRDYRVLTEFWKEQNEVLVGLVEGNTKAQTDTAAALRESSVVMHQAKNVMATHLPNRREGEPYGRIVP